MEYFVHVSQKAILMYKIFIVDDEAEIRNGLCNFFPWSSIGFEVAGQADNGQKAYEMLQTQHVDVLLCDIVMPVLSGLDLAKRLYEEKKPIWIIFMSAYADFQYAKEALDYGVKSYFLKSMRYDELIQTLTKIKAELDKAKREISEDTDTFSYNDKIIHHMKQFAKSDFAHVKMEIIAHELNLSADYLSKFFKKYTGSSFSDYVKKVRMNKAAELLRDIRYNVYEISKLVGYSNQFNFTRAFKSYYNKTPLEYRRCSSPSD